MMKVGRKSDGPVALDETRIAKAAPARGDRAATRKRRPADGAGRTGGPRAATSARRGPRSATPTRPSKESRGARQGPATAPTPRPADRPARPKTTTQAKARAHARKAKAPKVIRPSLRERLITRLEGVDLRPRALLARIPFVMLVIGALALGLGITLWLSTASAQRSYQLGSARTVNDALSQQKEALERDVLEAQSAPALADAARNLGMIPSRDTAHLVQDPAGNWVVVGMPKPAQGAPPPPLNTKLPDPAPPAPPVKPVAPKPGAAIEVPRRITSALPGAALPAGVPALAGPEVPVLVAPVTVPGIAHAPVGGAIPGPPPLPGPVITPSAGDTLALAPAAPVAPFVPTVAAVPVVPGVTNGVAPVGPAQ
jgi:hypothetical protein